MADNTQKFIQLFRAKRPDLEKLSDEQLGGLLKKSRPDLFPKQEDAVIKSLKSNPSSTETQQLESLGEGIARKMPGLKQPQYYFTAAGDEPEKKEDDFLPGLRDAWSQTQTRLKFFKANPERAKEIKGQATAYQFEPLLSYLEPKEEEPITKRVAKELVMLTAIAPVMGMTMAEDPISGISQMGQFMNDMAVDWLKLVDPDKRSEGWAEIKKSPLFHATFLSGVRRAKNATKLETTQKYGVISKKEVYKGIEKDIKEFQNTAEKLLKEKPELAETLQSIARDRVKKMEFNELAKDNFKAKQVAKDIKLLPATTSPKIQKLNLELANLQETLKSQEYQLKNINLTQTQKQRLNKSKNVIEELIEDIRIKGQQFGVQVKRDIKPGETPEYLTTRKQGKVLSQEQIDKLYLDSSGEVILLPESKGLHEPVKAFYEKSFKDMEGVGKQTWQDVKKKLITKTIDVSGNVKKELREQGVLGQQAAIMHDLALGSNAKSVMIFEDAAKRIFNGLNKHERKLLDTMIETRRNITIKEYRNDYKIPGGYQGNIAYLNEIKKSDPRLYKKLNSKADEFFSEMNMNLKELYDNGLINDKTYSLLKDKDYTSKEFIDYIDPGKSYTSGGKKITVTSSGLKSLEKGSEKSVNLDQAGKLFRNISLVQSRIAKNKSNLSMRDMIKENPNNGIATELKKGQKPPAGYEAVSYFEKGKKKEFYMPKEFANEWVVADPAINSNLANTVSWLSGNKILKSMATGYNPEFALVNFPRDIGYVYLTTSEYSPHLPKFAAQMSRDLGSVAVDAFTRKGKYRDYVMEGGGMEYLTHQGGLGKSYKPAGKITNAFEAFKSIASYAGETSEIWVRLALRERALRNGKSPLNATYEARNYLDFAQGGSFIKALDSAMPYLNATVQATRGLVRSAKNKPKDFATKSAWISGTASSLWFANNVVNGEAYDQINERIRNDNWIVTTPFSYTDERGNKRYMYYKFPKDQGQRIIASTTDALLEKTYKNKDASDQVIEGLKDLAGFVPTASSLPPGLDALLGASINYDFFKGEPIYDDRGRPIDPTEEFTPGRTGQAFIDFAQSLPEKAPDIVRSPDRLEYMVEQFTTRRNIWTDLVGGGYKTLTQGQDEQATEEFTRQMLKDIPGARRFVSFTSPYQEDKELKRTIIEKNTKDKQRKDFSRQLFTQFNNSEMTKKEVIDSIKQSNYDMSDKQKMLKRFVQSYKTKNVRNPGFYYDGLELNAVQRADYFFQKYSKSEKEEKKTMIDEMKRIPGFASKPFIERFNVLSKRYMEQKKK
tara:strand:+ start:11206 stop:15063 length:3858 start_codon:yes stop_codon:yes gene_type:complete